MIKDLSITIIIPVIAVNDYIRESISQILNLDWPDYEVIIFTDLPDHEHRWPKTKIIPSGKTGPAEKRDLALKYAQGEILAFLDDDAYPKVDWLKKALRHFNNPTVAAVGGPAVTPQDDDLWQKLSGTVFESLVGGGNARNRYLPISESHEVDDWPTVNLLVRKEVFRKVGGFDNTYWPGEDTKLCLDIINAGYKIIYEPTAVVYHHRRSDLLKHFKQIGNYALHRGYFAKIYPQTSRKPLYFLPTILNLYLIGLLTLYIFGSRFQVPGSSLLIFYLAALIIDGCLASWRWRLLPLVILTPVMILLTHVWYGIRFVQGLLTRRLVR